MAELPGNRFVAQLNILRCFFTKDGYKAGSLILASSEDARQLPTVARILCCTTEPAAVPATVCRHGRVCVALRQRNGCAKLHYSPGAKRGRADVTWVRRISFAPASMASSNAQKHNVSSNISVRCTHSTTQRHTSAHVHSRSTKEHVQPSARTRRPRTRLRGACMSEDRPMQARTRTQTLSADAMRCRRVHRRDILDGVHVPSEAPE